jgi:hypothetical protein
MMHKVHFGNPAGTGARSKPEPNGAGAALPFQPFATVVQRKRSWAWFALHNRALGRVPSIIQAYTPPSLFGKALPLPLPLPLLLTRERDPLPARRLEPTIIQQTWELFLAYPLSTWALFGSVVLSAWFLYLGFTK